jgi:hypothetical protein
MDFLPDKEFHPIFDRVSRKVNLKGAGSSAEINRRLKLKIDGYKYLQKKKALHVFEISKKEAKLGIRDLKKLIFRGFGRRTIDEAIARPRGKVALTLIYGRENAKDILLERSRKRIGSTRVRRRR